MDALSRQTKILLHEIQNGLSFAEHAKPEEADAIENKLTEKINIALGNCDRLEHLVKKEHPSKREELNLHVDKLKYDCKHLQSALQSIQHRRYLFLQMFSTVRSLLWAVQCNL